MEPSPLSFSFDLFEGNIQIMKQNTAVTAFIPWQGKALIVQRSSDEEFLPNHWEQVGGKLEPGESQTEALVREVKEEAGLIIKPIHSYNEMKYNHADGRFITEHAYICELTQSPQVVLSPEHQRCLWVTQKELHTLSPMTDYMRQVITKGFQEVSQ